MVVRLQFSLQNTDPMLRRFTKGGLSNPHQSQSQDTGQEAAVLREGTEMTTKIGITGEEATVEVWIGMIVTGIAGRTKIIVAGAGAVVPVLITTGVGEEAVTMMSAEVGVEAEVDLWIVPPLLGVALVLAEVHPLVGLHLLGVKVLTCAVVDGPQLLLVFRP